MSTIALQSQSRMFAKSTQHQHQQVHSHSISRQFFGICCCSARCVPAQPQFSDKKQPQRTAHRRITPASSKTGTLVAADDKGDDSDADVDAVEDLGISQLWKPYNQICKNKRSAFAKWWQVGPFSPRPTLACVNARTHMLLRHTGDVSAVSHCGHVCCVTQQPCSLCDTANLSAE